jgi:hypothetical protein
MSPELPLSKVILYTPRAPVPVGGVGQVPYTEEDSLWGAVSGVCSMAMKISILF